MNDHPLLHAVRTYAREFIDLRRDIHGHPELSFGEHRTAELVASRLKSWGYEVECGLGGTGVVGRLRKGSGRRALGLRADMDALPIQEATGLPYASRNPGVMHACGHDGHTAMLLCAARVLAESGGFSGTLNLIFQPAEEYGTDDSGAVRMMADGLFQKYPCDAIFAMHNMPGWPRGRLVFREGAMMASSDKVCITLEGCGGHGALPHKAADPVVAAASLVMALQTVVSRNVDPQDTAVVTVGVLRAGHANNVIPQSARLELSVRTLDPEVRRLVEQRIEALVHAQAQSFGVTARIDYRRGYAVLVNSCAETEFARLIGEELLGADRIERQGPALTGSEDFAYMLEKRPGSYLLIGNGEGDEAGACMVHNPGYDFNDENLAIGAAYWVLLARRFLA
ncbi:N-acyl-L-amino acid amidohydrolase [Castellaniella defragrans 65Phen]|uniref:N-acyl-L-amino acid amidohydrolase n=2 Tax=Castellaniella defragrans TaxID=75697 RepID=W8X8E4_CASD6|nr:M20 aminoacylase family protein [Castellaniella defragrans]KAB0608772.1 amidohydrolase [Castellaniella defragrans]MBB6082127.1 hippurate hydrolase [Castellaniella defragrans]CDM22930.1 N-acyl-L-amino acid amidohydrolase [Castellaniella defragrans 65Phen]